MCVNTFDLQVRQREQFADKGLQFRQVNALPMCSCFDLQVDSRCYPSIFRATGKRSRDVLPVNDLPKISGDNVVELIDFRVPEDRDRLIQAKIPHFKGFFEVIYSEPVGVLRSDRSNDFEAVSVSVGFYNRHNGRARRHNGAKRFKISSDRGRIDFNPAQHRNILF
jgi:hypothetical protein